MLTHPIFIPFFFLNVDSKSVGNHSREVWPVRMSAGWTFGKLQIELTTTPRPHSQPQGLLIYFRVESRSLKENRAAEPAIHLQMSASCFIVFFLQAVLFFFHILVDQRITSASFKSHGGPVETLTVVLGCLWVFVLRLYHEVYRRRLSPLKPAHLWLLSQASCWCFTVRSLRKSYSITARETCLSSRKCVARRPHHMSLAGEALLCFGSQSSPDVETGSSQMDVSLVSLSMDAWTQEDVSARCYTKAIKEIYLLKRRGTTCFLWRGSVLLWSNSLWAFSQVSVTDWRHCCF